MKSSRALSFLALALRQPPGVVAAREEHVEDVVRHGEVLDQARRRVRDAQPLLQHREAGLPVAERDDLAVDDEVIRLLDP